MSTNTHRQARHASHVEMETLSDAEQLDLIELRAYDLWERAGRVAWDGRRDRFWAEAEKEVLASHATRR